MEMHFHGFISRLGRIRAKPNCDLSDYHKTDLIDAIDLL